MQDDYRLTITAILRHGSRVYGTSECVTWLGDGSVRRATYAEVARNAERLAAALTRLGVQNGDRVGTFCWNHQEHLEAYYAVPCMGAVLHTLNIRLPATQLAQIVNHAEDKIVIVDGSLLPLLAPIAGDLTSVEAFVVVGEGDVSLLGEHTRAALRRACRRGGAGLCLARSGRAIARVDVLHERDDRRSEGRRVLPPLDVPACARRIVSEHHRRFGG
jgi:fatty-acyl-CoA synthase